MTKKLSTYYLWNCGTGNAVFVYGSRSLRPAGERTVKLWAIAICSFLPLPWTVGRAQSQRERRRQQLWREYWRNLAEFHLWILQHHAISCMRAVLIRNKCALKKISWFVVKNSPDSWVESDPIGFKNGKMRGEHTSTFFFAKRNQE